MKTNRKKNLDHVYVFDEIEDFIEELLEIQIHFLPKDKLKDKEQRVREERKTRLTKYIVAATAKKTFDVPGFDDLGISWIIITKNFS